MHHINVPKNDFVSLLLPTIISLTYPSFTCGPMSSSSNCIEYHSSNTTYLISECNQPLSPYCPPIPQNSPLSSFQCTSPPASPLNCPGESCHSSADCISSTCINTKCQGLGLGPVHSFRLQSRCDVQCKSLLGLLLCAQILSLSTVLHS